MGNKCTFVLLKYDLNFTKIYVSFSFCYFENQLPGSEETSKYLFSKIEKQERGLRVTNG